MAGRFDDVEMQEMREREHVEEDAQHEEETDFIRDDGFDNTYGLGGRVPSYDFLERNGFFRQINARFNSEGKIIGLSYKPEGEGFLM